MTPEKPRAELINARLHEIALLIEDLKELGTVEAEQLMDDRRTRHLAERELSQIVELATSINAHISAALRGIAPMTYHDSFRELARTGVIDHSFARRLQPSAELRNALVHEYMDINGEQVAAAIPMAIEQYGEYISRVAR